MTILQTLKGKAALLCKKLGISVNRTWMSRLGTPSVIKVTIAEGKCFFMKGTNLSLENRVFWRGFSAGHEPETSRRFADFAKHADWVIDVGANSGFFSLIAKTMNPEAKVAAFEPHPFFYSYLEENARLNDYEILAINKAASNSSGKLTFLFANPNQGNVYSGTLNETHFKNHQSTQPNSIEIKTITLDESVAAFGWTTGGLVKIDAEGHDEEVLQGFCETIKKYLPVMIVEIQSEKKAESVARLPFLENYEFFGINDKLRTMGEALPIPYSIGCDNYLFLPKDQ